MWKIAIGSFTGENNKRMDAFRDFAVARLIYSSPIASKESERVFSEAGLLRTNNDIMIAPKI